MANKTCFVVMPIGDQVVDGATVSQSDLKNKYDDLIKEALLRARPGLEIVRADDVSLPGTMTTDIVTRIMHSDYVVADVTYPNANVFYELGLRHACKPGTIIIKDSAGPRVPFDIAHLRYVEYENTPTGLKALSVQLAKLFEHFDREPERPDNLLLELAKLTNYEFPDYRKSDDLAPEVSAMMGLIQSPDLMSVILKQQNGEEVDEGELMQALFTNPQVMQPFLTAMVKSGDISFSGRNRKKR